MAKTSQNACRGSCKKMYFWRPYAHFGCVFRVLATISKPESPQESLLTRCHIKRFRQCFIFWAESFCVFFQALLKFWFSSLFAHTICRERRALKRHVGLCLIIRLCSPETCSFFLYNKRFSTFFAFSPQIGSVSARANALFVFHLAKTFRNFNYEWP